MQVYLRDADGHSQHTQTYYITTAVVFLGNLLGAFAELRKATTSFMSVRPPARNHDSNWTDFHEIWHLCFFSRKSVKKIQVSLTPNNNNGYFTFSHSWQCLPEFSLQWEMFQVKHVEKIKTHILCFVSVSWKIAPFMRMWKNMVEPARPKMTTPPMHFECWITKATHTHTHRMCNTYWFSITKNGCTNYPLCYVIRTLPVLLIIQPT